MLVKDRRRGLRRWRSRCAWMRRLRSDWNDHGWKRNPVHWNSDYYLDGTTLCNCFFPDSREAVRFKDTPHGSCSGYECDPRRFAHGVESRPIQEWRAMRPESDDEYRGQSSRKYRRNVRRYLRRDQCFCGYFLGWRDDRRSIMEDAGKCPDCQRKTSHVRFVNGVLVRQPA